MERSLVWRNRWDRVSCTFFVQSGYPVCQSTIVIVIFSCLQSISIVISPHEIGMSNFHRSRCVESIIIHSITVHRGIYGLAEIPRSLAGTSCLRLRFVSSRLSSTSSPISSFVARLVNSVESLPLLDVEVRILGTLLQALVVSRLCLDFSAHEGCKLFHNVSFPPMTTKDIPSLP
jgi:hypothetical protein